MTVGVWILGDQLWQGQAALAEQQDSHCQTPVILIESRQHGQQNRFADTGSGEKTLRLLYNGGFKTKALQRSRSWHRAIAPSPNFCKR